jgi:hypothetical protein
MELAPRYCRSCGSRILVKNVCHNCNNDPIKGDNYCYDCGALTPNADACLKCGARYKKTFPVSPVAIGSLVLIVIAAAVFFLTRSDKEQLVSQEVNTATPAPVTPEPNKQELPATHDTIVNHQVDTTAIVINKPIDSVVAKNPVKDSANANTSGTFTAEELKTYNTKCSYFMKGQRGQVIFFIAAGSGYIKMNNNIYELKRKHKGVDVAVFGGTQYEATVRIEGLSGSAKEWLASCTLTIKNLAQNTSIRHKVFSSCIEL